MSTTSHAPASATSITTAARPKIWTRGVAVAGVAATATTVLAAVASAAGVSFADRTGTSIPLAAFAELTVVFSLIGVALAAIMARRARRPQTTFVRTAVVLTAMSFVPDLTFGFDFASAATLIALHSVAASIMVPSLAGRLAPTR